MRFAIALALLTVSCSSGGGGSSSTTPPPTTSPPSPAVAACSVPFETAVLSEGAPPRRNLMSLTTAGRGAAASTSSCGSIRLRRAPGRRRPGPTLDIRSHRDHRGHRPDRGRCGTKAISCCRRTRSTCGRSAFALCAERIGRLRRPALRSCVSEQRRRQGFRWATTPARGLRCRSPFPYYAGRYTRSLSQLRRQRHLRVRGSREYRSERRAVPDRTAADRADLRRSRSFEGRPASFDGPTAMRCSSPGATCPSSTAPSNRVNVQLRLAGGRHRSTSSTARPSRPRAPSSACRRAKPASSAPVTSATRRGPPSAAAAAPSASALPASRDLDFVALTKKFYQTHGDDFDQLVLFTNTRTTEAGTFAFEFTVANEVAGIGSRRLRFEPRLRQPRPPAQRRRHGPAVALPRRPGGSGFSARTTRSA